MYRFLMTYVVEDALVVVGPGHAGELDLPQDVGEVLRGRRLLELSTHTHRKHTVNTLQYSEAPNKRPSS